MTTNQGRGLTVKEEMTILMNNIRTIQGVPDHAVSLFENIFVAGAAAAMACVVTKVDAAEPIESRMCRNLVGDVVVEVKELMIKHTLKGLIP